MEEGKITILVPEEKTFKVNRISFIESYISIFNSEPLRTSTIMYDLTGLLSYIVDNQSTIEDLFSLLNNKKLSFEGIDGQFNFERNIIKRKLRILQISKGEALLLK